MLRIIENSNRKAGRFIAGLLGMGWSLVTFLVVPILVIDGKGPFEAFKASARLLKKTWGEQLIGNFSFGLVFFLLGLPGIILIVLSIAVASIATPLGIALIILGIGYMLLLGLIQSTLQIIFQAALYLYAQDGRVPEGFDAEQISHVMSRR